MIKRFTEFINESSKFDQWFEGSLVVNGKGKPLPVYHGYEPSKGIWSKPGTPAFFCKDKKVAEYFGENKKVAKAYLSIKKPILFCDDGSESWGYTTLDRIKNISDKQRWEIVLYAQEKHKYRSKFKNLQDFYKNRGNCELYINDVADYAMKHWNKEFDGIIAKNIYEGDDDRFFTDDYVPFSPEQIRLA